MSQPLIAGSSQPVRGFLIFTEQSIRRQEWIPAITALINSLAEEDPKTCFHYILQLLPYCDETHFSLLKSRLPLLLNRCCSWVSEQQALALALGEWSLNHLPPTLTTACEAMHDFAKALQIAAIHDFSSQKKIHRVASQLFIPLLKSFSSDFGKKLDSARRGGASELPHFLLLLDHISCLKRFCFEDSHRLLIESLYLQASQVLNQVPAEKVSLYGSSLISQGLLESRTFPFPANLPTERYHEALVTFRATFKTSGQSVRELQHSTTEAFKTFFQILFDDALALLGPPPCTYDIRAMGSCGRQELCPFSDLEFMILIQDSKHTSYFKSVVEILELQIASLGETSTDHPPFTCLGPKNLSGLHIDMSPAKNQYLIQTPQEMAKLQKTDIDHPQNIEQTVLKTISLASNDPTLFTTYQAEVLKLLASSTTTLRASSSSSLSSAPTTTAATALALISSSSSPIRSPDTISPLLQREKRALAFFQVRLQDFQDRWKQPFHSALITFNLKTHFVELLNHLLSDMALYFGLASTNTLDIIDELVTLNIFTSASGTLLKESVSDLYKIRLRLHFLYGQQNEEAFIPGSLSPYVLIPEEYEQLERIYHLILVPLYATLPQILVNQTLPSHLDLAHTAFNNGLIHQTLTSPLIRHFVQHLLATNAPDTLHLKFYNDLSKSSVDESLRDTYLKTLQSSSSHQSLLTNLASIPTPAGLRVSFRRSQESLETQLLAITTVFPTTIPEVAVTAPSWPRPRYLAAEACQQALDSSGHLKKSYSNSAHNVCRVQSPINAGSGSASYDLHLKQKPSHPLMEYAIHNLTSRLAGDLTPPTLLVRFDLPNKISYPVLISQTVPGQSLKTTQDFDKKNWTWHLLTAILTRPGDGRLSNYVVHQQKLYCIDNDISFLEPVVTKALSREVQLAAAPFCLYPLDTPLDPQVLQEFAALDSAAILDGWIEDVIQKEQENLKLFAEDDVRKKLYEEDPDNTFTPTILFREGTLATLNLQFFQLQNWISSTPPIVSITAQDLLEKLISIREEKIGVHVVKAYQKALKFPLETRIQKAIEPSGVTFEKSPPDRSMTSQKFHQKCLGKVPSWEEIEKEKKFSPQEARKELFQTLLRSSLYASFNITKASLIANFEPLKSNQDRQRLILKALLSQQELLKQKPKTLVLNHSSILTGNVLEPFLHPDLEHLDLRYCSRINDDDVEKIASGCPKLKKLSLSGCEKITSVAGSLFSPELVFAQLEQLDFNRCSQLKNVNLQAPLQSFEAKHNPLLLLARINSHELKDLTVSYVTTKSLSSIPLAFGAAKWAEYIGDIGSEVFLPSNVIELLESPCPIWSGKKVKEMHLLTLIPQTVNGKPLTLQLLGELVKKPLKGNATKFRNLYLKEYKDPPVLASHWALMSRDVIPGSRNQTYAQQQTQVKRLAEKSQIPYEVPNILDVCVSLFMHDLQTGERLHGDDPWTYTRCQEKYDKHWQLVAGGFSSGGLLVSCGDLVRDFLGVSVLRKF